MDWSVVWLAVWGTVVGLDLVTGPQVMLTRPIVAAPVAGWIVGDIAFGMFVGVILEMYALEILPFGAARYPDYGLGAVVAVFIAAGAPHVLGVGISLFVGLGVAIVGEQGIQVVRRLNSADLMRHQAQVEEGDWGTITGLHMRGISRDVLRAFVVVALGLSVGLALRRLPPLTVEMAVVATCVATGIAVGTAFVSGLRLSGGGPRYQHWFAAGLAAGIAWVVLT